MPKLTEDELKQAIDTLREVADEVEGTLRTYSGRCMYGKYCYGITCSDATACIEAAAAAGIRGASVDGMGLDHIVYWQHIKAEKDIVEVEADDD